MDSKLSFKELLSREREVVLAEMRVEQEKSRADIPERALAWLALPPVWTLALADACHFPLIPGTSVRETLQRLYSERLCNFMPATHEMGQEGSDDECYTISSTTRDEILQRFSRDPQKGIPWLQQHMHAIGAAILQAESTGIEVLARVERWARLASNALERREVADLFTQKIDDLLADKHSGEVLLWIETARPLEELLGGELTPMVRRAGRRLELFHRRSDDERSLSRFLLRDRQAQDFRKLVAEQTTHWALHYIGDGGVGKTMLACYITARLPKELSLSVARIDFDFLNPDYPARQPGLLLDQFAAELRLQDDPTEVVTKLFTLFDEKLVKLHENLSQSSPNGPPIAGIEHPDFDGLVTAFANAAAALPLQPVVLIFDTCEELAKLRPDGTLPESVQATFTILEKLHTLLPSLRVVFCGRRPLAVSGSDWNYLAAEQIEQREKTNSWWNLPRPYLRLHEIRGFSHKEAEDYLLNHAGIHADPDLVEAIIKRSPELGYKPRFRWRNPQDEPTRETCYNPFDLALYAAWVKEEPDLTPEMIRTAKGDHYVERRIVMRNHALQSLLPAVTLLGRFKREMLRSIVQLDPTTFDRIFEELVGQEWIDRQRSQFFTIKRGLLPRLRAYFQEKEPHKQETMRASIADYLERITLEQPLSELDLSYFDSALRLLEKEPERAAIWWKAIETRIASAGAYQWLYPYTEFMLSNEGAAAALDPLDTSDTSATFQESPLRAAILATHVAALTHCRLTSTLLPLFWAEVQRKAERHPNPEEAARLVQRALAGQVVAQNILGQVPEKELVKAFWQALATCNVQTLDEQLVASFAAALEAVIEHLEVSDYSDSKEPMLAQAPLIRLAKALVKRDIAKELQVFVWSLAGRLLILQKKSDKGLEWFQRALGLQLGPYRQSWLDWLAPDDLGARIRLEYVKTVYPAIQGPEAVLDVIGDILSRPQNIDRDRLDAANLILHAASQPLSSDGSEQLISFAEQSRAYMPVCRAHEAFPPLCTVVAVEVMAGSGQVDRAISYLQNRSKSAEQSANDLETQHEADRAYLQIMRRMRLRDEGRGFTSSLLSSTKLQDQAIQWVLKGLDGPKSPDVIPVPLPDLQTDRFSEVHARWRSTYARRQDKGEVLLTWIRSTLSLDLLEEASSFAQLSCLLDQLEANLLANWLALEHPYPKLRTSIVLFAAHQWVQVHTQQPQDALVISLRAAALEGHQPIQQRFLNQLGLRRAAEIALDEGELLALRLPLHAASLLTRARAWFAQVEDYGQAVIAGTCAALALILSRRPKLDEISSILADVQKDYQTYQSGMEKVLPLWQMIEAIAHSEPMEDQVSKLLDESQFLGWRPWLVRLMTCLIWNKGALAQGTQAHYMQSWLNAHYGVTIENKIVLPAELDSILISSVESPVPEVKELAAKVTVVIRSSAYSHFSSSIDAPVGFVMSFRRLDGSRFEFEGMIVGVDAYSETASQLPATLQAELYSLLEPLFRKETIEYSRLVELQVDELVSGICWEGIISEAVEDRDNTHSWELLQFFRVMSITRHKVGLPSQQIARIVSWIDKTTYQAEIARLGWKHLAQDEHFSVEIMQSGEIRSRFWPGSQQGASISVLHLVADTLETASGVRLRGDSSSSESFKTRGGDLLRGEDELLALFPALRLCILQAPPQPMSSRTSFERAQAGNLRLLASELFEAGIPIVVTLPPLPIELGAAVLEPFAAALQASPEKPNLLQAVNTAKALLLQRTGLHPQDAKELAQDICLYIDQNFAS